MRRLLLAGAALSLLGGVAEYGVIGIYRRAGPLAQALDVVVPRGAFADLAAVLQRSGVVAHSWELRGFELATTLQGPIRAAEFSFPAGVSIERVLLILRHGRPVQHLLTVPEGVTSARVGRLMAEARALTGPITVPEEGRFLPESYAYQLGDGVGAVLARGRVAMDAVVARIWRERAAGLPLRSEHQLIVLASLVERETHLPGERAVVAAVFLNRLRIGMRLQADSSVEYAVGGGTGELGHGLRRDELDWATPYNTYLQAGLPLGAICEPGTASLQASAHPASTDALYFVADGSGGHVFTRSLDVHRSNVARFRAFEHAAATGQH